MIIWFWNMVLETYTEVHRRKLLFATGNDRIPTNGFKGLRFVIQKANSHNDDHLPTAHTCFNIMLSEYSSKDILLNHSACTRQLDWVWVGVKQLPIVLVSFLLLGGRILRSISITAVRVCTKNKNTC